MSVYSSHNLFNIYVRFSIFARVYGGLSWHAYYKVPTYPWRRWRDRVLRLIVDVMAVMWASTLFVAVGIFINLIIRLVWNLSTPTHNVFGHINRHVSKRALDIAHASTQNMALLDSVKKKILKATGYSSNS